jgi:aminoglycoside 6'-N-acetyltransferase
MADLRGDRVTLRPLTASDIPAVVAIRMKPDVAIWWGPEPEHELIAEFVDRLADDESETFVILLEGRVIGAIQWYANEDPQYRHAGMDMFLDPAVRGGGLGPDAVRTIIRHLIDEYGFHRFVIDPSAENAAAIACYAKVGFKPVGIMREYERTDPDGPWHDGLLMDLLARELS